MLKLMMMRIFVQLCLRDLRLLLSLATAINRLLEAEQCDTFIRVIVEESEACNQGYSLIPTEERDAMVAYLELQH